MSETTVVLTRTVPDAEQRNAIFRRIAIYFSQLNPTGSFSLSYMTEGAANTIWLLHFKDSNLSKYDSSVVLRMRKNVQSTSMLELKKQYEERIAPLFAFNPGLLLPVHLIQIDQGLIADLNARLLKLEYEEARKQLRVGIYHPPASEEPYAMILPNLAYSAGRVVEFKPKWLVQSPSAPRDAQRCRTCALNAMRRASGVSGRGDCGFCPFDLLSSHDRILHAALTQLWRDQDSLHDFAQAFKSRVQPALRQLQNIQRLKNAVGLRDFGDHESKDFGVAMALRDCSVVLQVGRPRQEAEEQLDILLVKLLDLDLKLANSSKLKKWAGIEQQLIDGGWYTRAPDDGITCAMTFQ